MNASETGQDVGAAARKLQLEGTRLQLQGNLAEAIGKYQESLALKANPKLEQLVNKLEKKTGAAATVPVAQVPAVAVEEQDGPQEIVGTMERVEESPAEVLLQKTTVQASVVEENTEHEQKSVVVRHPSATPEEELIYAFTDWMLGFFPDRSSENNFGLVTNRNYTISPSEDLYEVRLEPFIIYADEDTLFDFSPVVLTLQPRGDGRLGVQMEIPDRILSLDGEKTVVAEMVIQSQSLSGTWDLALQNFEKSELKLNDISVQDAQKTGRLAIKEIQFGNLFTRKEQGLWQEHYQGSLNGLSFALGDDNFAIEKIVAESRQDGSNFKRYIELKKDIMARSEDLENIELTDTKVFFSSIDEFIQLVNATTSKVVFQGVTVNIDGNINLDSIEISGSVLRDVQNNGFIFEARGDAQGFSFMKEGVQENSQPVSLFIDHIGIVDSAELLEIPTNLFADLFTILESAEKLEGQDAEVYLAEHGMAFTKKILQLVKGYSAKITLGGLKVVNVMPAPVTLESAQISTDFDAGDGAGGTINTLVDFSGFNGIDQNETNIPQAARIAFEMKNIPSLLNLISDPGGLASGDIDQLQGQVMMNGMQTLMSSGLTISLLDTFVAFPDTRLDADLTAKVNPESPYMATGTVNLSVENPDRFSQLVNTMFGDPDLQQMLATFTAMAKRKEENGKIVDRVHAEFNPQGRVVLNGKDVTDMFFPSAGAGVQQAEPTPDKVGEVTADSTMPRDVESVNQATNVPFHGRISLVETVDPVAREAVDTVLEWNKSYLQEGDKVTNAVIDLNNDGLNEILVRTEGMYLCSGPGYINGCRTWIMQRKDGKWDNIGFPYANEIEVLSTGRQGYADLKIDGETYIYNGSSYGAE